MIKIQTSIGLIQEVSDCEVWRSGRAKVKSKTKSKADEKGSRCEVGSLPMKDEDFSEISFGNVPNTEICTV